MLLNVLAVGDVVGEGGQDILARRLREVKREEDIHFTAVSYTHLDVYKRQVQAPGHRKQPADPSEHL